MFIIVHVEAKMPRPIVVSSRFPNPKNAITTGALRKMQELNAVKTTIFTEPRDDILLFERKGDKACLVGGQSGYLHSSPPIQETNVDIIAACIKPCYCIQGRVFLCRLLVLIEELHVCSDVVVCSYPAFRVVGPRSQGTRVVARVLASPHQTHGPTEKPTEELVQYVLVVIVAPLDVQADLYHAGTQR